MAWLNRTSNSQGFKTETKTLPTSGTGYSSVMDFLKVIKGRANQYVSFLLSASAVSGTNLDIGLYGAMTESGVKFLLKDAIVADITNSAKDAGGVIDLQLYPAPNYFIGWITDADEDANTITASVFGEFTEG